MLTCNKSASMAFLAAKAFRLDDDDDKKKIFPNISRDPDGQNNFRLMVLNQ